MTKKRRSLFIVFGVICVCVLSSAFVLTGCGGKHKFKGDWVSDETSHWKECTKHDDCGEIDGPYEHVWDEGVVTTEPTCAEGKATYTCTECGYTTTEILAATAEHTFTITDETKDITWTWSTDGKSATATAVCDVCKETVSLDVVMSSAEDENGNTVYTATVTINGTTYTSTKTVEAGSETPEPTPEPTHVHSYVLDEGATWTWGTDESGNDVCYASGTCTNEDGLCDALGGYVYAAVTDASSEATCTEPAYTWKVAQYGNDEVSSTEANKTSSGGALGHDFVVASGETWTWVADGSYASASATGTCSRCRETGNVKVDSTESTIAATCGDCGKIVYTVTYGTETVLTATVDDLSAPATNQHTFDEDVEIEWDWTEIEGGWSATATFTACSVCGKAVEYAAEVEAPAEGETLGTWTATVTVGDKTYTNHKEVGDINLSPEDAYFTLDEEKIYYENDSELTVVYDANSATYTLTGPANIMTEDQAKAYNGGSLNGQAQIGSNFVVYGIKIEPGETLTGQEIGTSGIYNNGEEDMYYPILMLLTKTSGSRTYTLTSTGSEGNEPTRTVTVSFSGVILKGTDSSYIELSPTDNTFLNSNVQFTNTTGFTAVLNGAGEWVLTGLANTMDHDQAEAWGTTDGTSFVVYAIMVPANATLTDLSNGKTYTNSDGEAVEYTICMGLSKTDGSRQYQIVATDGTTTIVTVSFAGVTLPAKGTESSWITVDPSDNTFEGSDVEFSNTEGFQAVLNEDGEWVLTGWANSMTHDQAEAWGTTDGTSFVVYAIMVPAGATLYNLRTGDVFENTGNESVEYTICMGLSTNTGYRAYKIVDEDENVTVVTVSFAGVDLPVQATSETWITLEPTDCTFEGNDVTFSNTTGFKFEVENGVFVLTGLANTMDKDQAEAWGTKAGASYVVYAIVVPAGATLYNLRTGDVFKNETGSACEYTVCMGLSKTDGYRAYKIVDEDGGVTIVTVSFAGVTLPTRETRTGIVITNPTDNKFPESEVEFKNTNGFTVELNAETGEWVLTGTANTMSDEQKAAWGTEWNIPFVVYAVMVPAGAILYDLWTGDILDNSAGTEAKEYSVCMGLSKTTGYRAYKIVDGDGNVSIVTVTFAGVELPAPTVTRIEVAEADENITLDLNGNTEINVSVIVRMSDGTTLDTCDGTVTWTVSENGYITVGGTGFSANIEATAVTSGTVTVTATLTVEGGTFSVSFDVTVIDTTPSGEGGGDEGSVTAHTQSSSFDNLAKTLYGETATSGADKTLTYEDLLESGNGFLKLSEETSDNVYRYQSSTNLIQIKGDGLSVEMYGTGSITVTIASTGTDNTSTFALKKMGSDGAYTYVDGTTISGTATATEGTDSQYGKYYSVAGRSFAGITFEITGPGVYVLATNVCITAAVDRATRISSVVVVDNYDEETTHVHSYTKTSDTTTCGVAGEKTFSCTGCSAGNTFVSTSLPTGEHKYEDDNAITVTTIPTEETTGTVTFTCDVCGSVEGSEGGVTTTELPVLSSTQYKKVENSGDSSMYDYTIEMDGFTITFTTDRVEAAIPSSETIIIGSMAPGGSTSSAVTMNGDLATVVIAKNGGGFSYKTGENYEKIIDGVGYWPVKMESQTTVAITVTVDCTVRIACYDGATISVDGATYTPVQAEDGYYYVTIEAVTANTSISVGKVSNSDSFIYFIEIEASNAAT